MRADPLSIPFEELLEHGEWVRALARRLVADSGLAEDLVQETWLAALRRPPGDRQNLRGWLGRVVTNAARQRHRREVPRRAVETAAAPGGHADAPEEALAAIESQRELAGLVLELDEPYRSTVVRRYWHDLTAAEIARRDGVPAGTARWRLKEGLDRLRSRLDERHGGDRRAWCLALLPLARQGAVPAGGALLTALVTGVLAMPFILKATLITTTLALTLLGLRAAGLFDPEPERVARSAEAPARLTADELDADLPAAPASAPRRAADVPAAAEERSAPVASSAASSARVEARAVDLAGQPVPDATLRTVSLWGDEVAGDRDGALMLELDPQAADRSLTFLFAAPGHATAEVEGVVRPGETLHLGDVALGPGGEVAGRVVDERGRPVEGAAVVPIDARLPAGGLERARRHATSGGSFWRAERTDASGAFLLRGVPAGEVRLKATCEGKLAAVGEPLAVDIGARVEDVELILEPLAREDVIAGQVLGADGEPVAYAIVSFEYRTWFRSRKHSTTTDAQGWFEELCDDGEARDIRVEAPHGRWRGAVLEDVSTGTLDLVVRLEEPLTMQVDVRDPSDRRLEHVDLGVWNVERKRSIRTEVSRTEEGTWQLRVPGERFVVVASAAGHEERELGPFDPDEPPALVECVLDAVPGLRGVVRADGRLLTGALVEVIAEAAHWSEKDDFPVRVSMLPVAQVASGDDGRFVATVRESGRFYVRVAAAGFAPAELGPLDFDPGRGLELGAVELTVGGAIEGRVVVAAGESPAGKVVGISRGDGHARTQRVGPEGAFRFEHLIPGPWQVELRDAELHPSGSSWSSDFSLPVATVPSNCVVHEARTTPFVLSTGDLEPCVLEGVLRVDGAPAAGWEVRLLGANVRMVTDRDEKQRTDTEGRFLLARAAPGPGRLTLTGDDGLTLVAEVELVEGRTEWQAELELGTLEVEGLVAVDERAPAALYLWERDGLLAAVQLFPEDDGTVRGLRVPAGSGTLVRLDPGLDLSDPWSLPVLAEVELPVGETRLVRLR